MKLTKFIFTIVILPLILYLFVIDHPSKHLQIPPKRNPNISFSNILKMLNNARLLNFFKDDNKFNFISTFTVLIYQS
jgi:hypothetical protein